MFVLGFTFVAQGELLHSFGRDVQARQMSAESGLHYHGHFDSVKGFNPFKMSIPWSEHFLVRNRQGLTIWYNMAVGVGHEQQSIHGKSQDTQDDFADQHKEYEARILIQAHCSHPQEASTKLDLISPGQFSQMPEFSNSVPAACILLAVICDLI